MNKIKSIAAMLTLTVVFFILLYIGGLVIEWSWSLFDSSDPGIFTLAIRALIVSGLSSLGALLATEYFFENHMSKSVAVFFSSTVLIWAAFFVYQVPDVKFIEVLLLGYLPIIITVAPPLFISIVIYKN